MRSSKYRYLRNHNAKKRQAVIRKKANLSNWLSSTIEGKCVPWHKSATLSVLVQPTSQSTTVFTPKAPKQNKEVVEAMPSVSNTVSQEFVPTKKQGVPKKQIQQQLQPTTQDKFCVEDTLPPPKHVNQQSKANSKADKNGKQKNTGKSTDKQLKKDKDTSKGNRQIPKQNGSTVIKAEVEEFMPNTTLTGALLVDVNCPQTFLANQQPSLTKCSVDSGVEDNLDENNLHQHSSSNSISNGSSSHEDSNHQDKQNGITKFAQNVADFVSQVQEKFESKSPQMIEHSVVSEQLKHVQKLESKPFIYKNDYSHLKKATVNEIQPRERKPRVTKLLPKDIEYCTYMMETYGEDYQSMKKDAKNIYMDEASGIARKIRVFRESPHYQEYLDSLKA